MSVGKLDADVTALIAERDALVIAAGLAWDDYTCEGIELSADTVSAMRAALLPHFQRKWGDQQGSAAVARVQP